MGLACSRHTYTAGRPTGNRRGTRDKVHKRCYLDILLILDELAYETVTYTKHMLNCVGKKRENKSFKQDRCTKLGMVNDKCFDVLHTLVLNTEFNEMFWVKFYGKDDNAVKEGIPFLCRCNISFFIAECMPKLHYYSKYMNTSLKC